MTCNKPLDGVNQIKQTLNNIKLINPKNNMLDHFRLINEILWYATILSIINIIMTVIRQGNITELCLLNLYKGLNESANRIINRVNNKVCI